MQLIIQKYNLKEAVLNLSEKKIIDTMIKIKKRSIGISYACSKKSLSKRMTPNKPKKNNSNIHSFI